jgi:hypothetical protein
MAKRRRRRLGHITDVERLKVRVAVESAKKSCKDRYEGHGQAMCIEGVSIVDRHLRIERF